MYKIGGKEVVLDPSTSCHDEYHNIIYSQDGYRIIIFDSLSNSISEQNCLKLAPVKTTRILLPKYPVYEDGVYCGCAYPEVKGDWIQAFFGKGSDLRKSFRIMKDEILGLSQMGIDLGSMPSYKSSGDFGRITFYGTHSIKDSEMATQATIQKNLRLYHEYLKDLVYNGMSEWDNISPEECYQYVTFNNPITTTLDNALNDEGVAGDLIAKDIKRKVHIK